MNLLLNCTINFLWKCFSLHKISINKTVNNLVEETTVHVKDLVFVCLVGGRVLHHLDSIDALEVLDGGRATILVSRKRRSRRHWNGILRRIDVHKRSRRIFSHRIRKELLGSRLIRRRLIDGKVIHFGRRDFENCRQNWLSNEK